MTISFHVDSATGNANNSQVRLCTTSNIAKKNCLYTCSCRYTTNTLGLEVAPYISGSSVNYYRSSYDGKSKTQIYRTIANTILVLSCIIPTDVVGKDIEITISDICLYEGMFCDPPYKVSLDCIPSNQFAYINGNNQVSLLLHKTYTVPTGTNGHFKLGSIYNSSYSEIIFKIANNIYKANWSYQGGTGVIRSVSCECILNGTTAINNMFTKIELVSLNLTVYLTIYVTGLTSAQTLQFYDSFLIISLNGFIRREDGSSRFYNSTGAFTTGSVVKESNIVYPS